MTPIDNALKIFREDTENPENQSQFFDLFLNSTFFVPIAPEESLKDAGLPPQEGVLPLIIESDGNDFLMLFDSRERMFAWADAQIKYVELPGHLIASTSRPPLYWALNVGTEHSKQFVPDEITWLREAVERCNAEAETAAKLKEIDQSTATNKEPAMPTANARHILVSTEEECLKLKSEIEGGADFATVAKANSSCPSRMQGGDLGTFAKGQMVREFDEVVFSAPIGQCVGPVKTQFGFHLIEVTKRW